MKRRNFKKWARHCNFLDNHIKTERDEKHCNEQYLWVCFHSLSVFYSIRGDVVALLIAICVSSIREYTVTFESRKKYFQVFRESDVDWSHNRPISSSARKRGKEWLSPSCALFLFLSSPAPRRYTDMLSRISKIDSRALRDEAQIRECLGVGFYDLLTLVHVYRTRCDGHAAPSAGNAATFANERGAVRYVRSIDLLLSTPLFFGRFFCACRDRRRCGDDDRYRWSTLISCFTSVVVGC